MNLLDEIPDQWIKASVGKYCDVQLGKMLQNDPASERDELKPYLRAINIAKNGLDLSHEFNMWIKPQELERFRLQRGDILVSEGGDAGRTAVFDSDAEYYFQNAINRVRPIGDTSILPEFIYYWFTFLKVAGYIEMICNVATIPHFTAEKVKAAPLALPPLETQRRIARFLDEKTARIDGLIEKKRALLDRLAEKRQALITRAVTKGLNPDAPLKPSGIDWFGDIPAHWEVLPLRRMIQLQRGHDLPSQDREDGDVLIVSSAGISGKHSQEVSSGPGIVTGRYGTIGEFYFIERPYWPLNTTLYSKFIYCYPQYGWRLLQAMTHLFVLNSLKSAVPGVDRNDIASEYVPSPPSQEQISIGAYVDKRLQEYERNASLIKRSVELLNEYRSALVTAAVTGKLRPEDAPDQPRLEEA